MKYKAVIFDMDGVLIDSEPIWRKVECDIFQALGVPLTIEMTVETMGLRCDAVTHYWFERYPWKGKSEKEVTDEIVRGVIDHVRAEGYALPGVDQALARAKNAGLKLAIASSSPDSLIAAVVDRLGLTGLDLTYSAEHEAKGKPEPDVYLTTANKLGVDPIACIAVEDSVAGVTAAKAAGMFCIAIPDERYTSKESVGAADLIANSLEDTRIAEVF